MIKYILCDIEGTTSSIHFVHEVLFPYFISHIGECYTLAEVDIEVADSLHLIGKQLEGRQAVDNRELVINQLKDWVKQDKKEPVLKFLQGKIWNQGFKSGELKGHFYPDVPQLLRKWTEDGLQIGIYSSGSVAAQKLIFQYSSYGDLSQWIVNNFDTAVGHKREPISYLNIAKTLHLDPQEILFLSDIEQELDAAQIAGLKVCQLVRELTVASEKHHHCKNFEEVDQYLSLI